MGKLNRCNGRGGVATALLGRLRHADWKNSSSRRTRRVRRCLIVTYVRATVLGVAVVTSVTRRDGA
jgi:hypothetical protein